MTRLSRSAAILTFVVGLPLAHRTDRPPDDDPRSHRRRARGRPADLSKRPVRGLRAHDDRSGVREAQRGHLDRAGRSGRRGEAAHRRRQERDDAALVAGWPATGVHRDARRRSAGVSRRRRRLERAQDHRRVRRRAAAARVLARRDDGRVRRRRLSRVQGRRVQPAAARGRGQGSGQGARHHAVAVSPLGRVARRRASPRVHRAGRGRARARCHARRLRLAARPAGGQRDRVRAQQQAARVRVESRRQRQGGVDDQ